MNFRIIKGDTLEEHIKSIDRILWQMSFSAKGKHAYAMISPVPVAAFVEDIDGPLLKFMSPAAGTITDISMYVENMPKAGINVSATWQSKGTAVTKSTFTKRQSSTVDSDFELSAGDRVTVSLSLVDPDGDKASGVWLAFLWRPQKKDIDVKNFLTDELLERT